MSANFQIRSLEYNEFSNYFNAAVIHDGIIKWPVACPASRAGASPQDAETGEEVIPTFLPAS